VVCVWSCLLRGDGLVSLDSNFRNQAHQFAESSLFLMSFFGFERSNLEQEKKKFLEGGLQETEDLAVYTWGEESYDGLGDALLEGGDELNDETFGGTGAVGEMESSLARVKE